MLNEKKSLTTHEVALADLDRRHDQLLCELDQLNEQIEATLATFSTASQAE